ncbi:MAG: hypothetical protein CML38_08035 [Rhodobacteraceae bacterium]|nr:MAG: hypothetical protein CML38_08035 [Paracoccaceae bacterium]
MNKQIDNKKSFFLLLLKGYFDLDRSVDYQLKTRTLERQLLPLVYYVSFALLIAKIPNLFVLKGYYLDQEFQYAKLGSILVVHIFFVPIFIYFLAFITHWVLLFFGSSSSYFSTRLAFFWSLSLGSSLVVLASLITAFITDYKIKSFFISLSELIVIYIFARILSYAANFKYRQIVLITLVSIYIFLNMVLPSLN